MVGFPIRDPRSDLSAVHKEELSANIGEKRKVLHSLRKTLELAISVSLFFNVLNMLTDLQANAKQNSNSTRDGEEKGVQESSMISVNITRSANFCREIF